MIARFQAIPELQTVLPELFEWMTQTFPEEQKVAIGLSGGADSMLVAFLFASFWVQQNRDPHQLFFVHCNHGVRRESHEEEAFLRGYFANWNLEIFTRGKEANSSENELRKRRYEAFQTSSQNNKWEVLALGHHLNDRIETSLMNLLRGCGLQGFLNMRRQETHHLLAGKKICRPLLELSKEHIENTNQQLGIPFFQDKTNFQPEISMRNDLRNTIIASLQQKSKHLQDGRLLLHESWKQLYQEIEQNEKSDASHRLSPIRLNPYRNAEQAFEWKIPPQKRTETTALAQLLQLLAIPCKKGEINTLQNRLQKGKEGFREIEERTGFLTHGRIFFIKGKKQFQEKQLLLEKEITTEGIQHFGLFELEIPTSCIGGTIRFPKVGDKFKGKSLSKRTINHKIPIFWRKTLPLVEKEGKIILIFRPEQLGF